MKKLVGIILLIVIIGAVIVYLDLAKPTTAAEKIEFGVWYLAKYGLEETNTSEPVQHALWRLSKLTSKKAETN